MTGFVYLIGSEHGPHKIGMSRNVPNRLRALQTNIPVKLRIMETWEAPTLGHAFAIEQASHAALFKHRVGGEWFDVEIGYAAYTIDGVSDLVERYSDGFTQTSGSGLTGHWYYVAAKLGVFAPTPICLTKAVGLSKAQWIRRSKSLEQ